MKGGEREGEGDKSGEETRVGKGKGRKDRGEKEGGGVKASLEA